MNSIAQSQVLKWKPALVEARAGVDFEDRIASSNSIVPLHESEGKSMNIRRASQAQHFQARGGNSVPRYSTEEVTDGFQQVLQQKYGRLKKPAAVLSEDSGSSERAARNHLSGESLMNLTQFFNACQTIPELQEWGFRMMGMKPTDPTWQQECERLSRRYYEIQAQRGGAE